jgi:hypothetical protein
MFYGFLGRVGKLLQFLDEHREGRGCPWKCSPEFKMASHELNLKGDYILWKALCLMALAYCERKIVLKLR